ncbi:N-acetyltransferase [Aeromonas enteropelogenes]|nr:N-acetyltransferase [Aeromonas enteropelogenes]
MPQSAPQVRTGIHGQNDQLLDNWPRYREKWVINGTLQGVQVNTTLRVNHPITPEAFVQLLAKTTLGARRPTENLSTIQGMLDNAGLLVTAWQGEELVGVARSVTDFCYCCYLSDLAVAEAVQGQGIGKALIRETFLQLQPGCKLILLAAPQAVDYYPRLGFGQHPSAWVMNSLDELS